MKAIELKNENVVLALSKREIVVLCSALTDRKLNLLKKNDLDLYFESAELFEQIFATL